MEHRRLDQVGDAMVQVGPRRALEYVKLIVDARDYHHCVKHMSSAARSSPEVGSNKMGRQVVK
jgi:hypothetical protein